MMQINNDYFEDLDKNSAEEIIQKLLKDDFPKPGSAKNRKSNAPEGEKKTLLEIILRIWLGIPFYFIHKFIFRGMFRAGTYGFTLSVSSAIGRWLKDVKQFEILMKDRNK